MRFLTAANPLTLTLALSRAALRHLFAVTHVKLILTAAVGATVVLVVLAGVYMLSAPLILARDFAQFLRGGALDLPAHVAACIPDSAAVHAGRYTESGEQIVAEIPQNATIAPATAFLLYRWSHIGDRWQPTWTRWEAHLGAQKISATASDIEIAQSVDPETDYTPYLVPARSTTIGLSIAGPVVAGKRQIEDIANQIYRECQRRDDQRRAAAGAPGAHQSTRSG